MFLVQTPNSIIRSFRIFSGLIHTHNQFFRSLVILSPVSVTLCHPGLSGLFPQYQCKPRQKVQYDNLTKGILFKHKVGPFDMFSLPSLLSGLKIVNCLQKSLQRVVRKLQTGLQGNKAEGQPMFGKTQNIHPKLWVLANYP